MNKQQLANKIWESANKMRSKIEANEYKDYILGFIFYKFLSDKEVDFLKKDGYEEADLQEHVHENNEELVDYCQQHLGYFIAYDNLFSTWLDKGNSFTVDNVRTALSAFNRLISDTQKKVFSKIFNTLETGLSKLGDSTSNQTKAIRDLIQLIKDIPTDGRQDYDVLGFIYESVSHDVRESILDTYVLEFLDLPEQFSEKNLRKAIIENLKQFILEFGRDFTFIGEEYRVQVGNTDFFIDLLFYNRALSCLVPIELKIGKFKPEHIGQINFYLEALDRDVKKPNENPSVGVILCASKDDAVVEYALSRSMSPTLVADYRLCLPDKTLLQNKLRELTELALESGEGNEGDEE